MGILTEFDDLVSKGKFGNKMTFLPRYRTGIDIFDYVNGSIDNAGNVLLGIRAGKIIQDVGNASTGKTSKLIKMACNIAEQFSECKVYHFDFERSTEKDRVLALSGWNEDTFSEKYSLLDKDISSESIYKLCKALEKVKIKHKDELMIDTGFKDINGKSIEYMQPSIVLIDSVALMAPEDIEGDDELKGSMGASAIAKSNTNIFKRIMSPITNANIIVMLVNHLTQKIEIGPFKSKPILNFLKPDENLPGGRAIYYLTDCLSKLEASKKLTPNEGFGVKGYLLDGTLVKSRNNEAGISYRMVFVQKRGIDNTLSNYVNLKEFGRISGAGKSFKLDTLPDIKFSQKGFLDIYNKNKEFRDEFNRVVHEEYSKFLNDDSFIKRNSINLIDGYTLVDRDNNIYQDEKDNYFQLEDGELKPVEIEEE